MNLFAMSVCPHQPEAKSKKQNAFKSLSLFLWAEHLGRNGFFDTEILTLARVLWSRSPRAEHNEFGLCSSTQHEYDGF